MGFIWNGHKNRPANNISIVCAIFGGCNDILRCSICWKQLVYLAGKTHSRWWKTHAAKSKMMENSCLYIEDFSAIHLLDEVTISSSEKHKTTLPLHSKLQFLNNYQSGYIIIGRLFSWLSINLVNTPNFELAEHFVDEFELR